jgi:hypothetical protein
LADIDLTEVDVGCRSREAEQRVLFFQHLMADIFCHDLLIYGSGEDLPKVFGGAIALRQVRFLP